MKKFIVSVLTFFIVFSSFFCASVPKLVLADSVKKEYLRVINEKTPFFKSVLDDEPLFFLPYTYYVKVLGSTGEFVHVELQGQSSVALDGYVFAEELFYDGLQVNEPYLNMNITTADTTVLYADPELTSPIQYIFADRQLCYYGEYEKTQNRVFFIGYNDRLGYVKESAILPFTIDNHPNPLTFLTPETPEENLSSGENSGFFSLKAVIFACLLFAGIIALIFALTNKRKTELHSNYFEENDYE